MKRPAFQFYPGDWLRHPGLRAVSIAARGLWIDMICIMHSGQPYGHLTIGKKVVSAETLAKLTGTSKREIQLLLAELEAFRIISKTDLGVFYSNRMVEDERIRLARANGGVKAATNSNASRNGDKRRGGKASSSEEGPLDRGVPEGVAQGVTSVTPLRLQSSSASAASTGVDAQRAREPESEINRAEPSRALNFVHWFVRTGLELGAIQPDRGLDFELTVSRESLSDAEALVATYDLGELERRAGRYFEAIKSRALRRIASIAAFREAWNYQEVRPPEEGASATPFRKRFECENVDRFAELDRVVNA